MKNNFVAKHASKFNRAATHDDRKKRERKGYRKHKCSLPNESYR